MTKTDNQKREKVLAWVKAMPDKERNAFWRGIVELSEAGRKAGIPAEDWAKHYVEIYTEVNRLLK